MDHNRHAHEDNQQLATKQVPWFSSSSTATVGPEFVEIVHVPVLQSTITAADIRARNRADE